MTKMSTTIDPGPWTPTDAMVEWAYANAAYTNAGEDPRVAFQRWLNMRLAAAWDDGFVARSGPWGRCANPYRSES